MSTTKGHSGTTSSTFTHNEKLASPAAVGQSRTVGDKEDIVPDGGWKAWATVAGTFCCQFVSFGWIFSIGALQAYYERNQLRGRSSSTVAWINSFNAFMLFFLGPVVSILYNRLGPTIPTGIGAALSFFGLMMTAWSTKFYQLILFQGVFTSVGLSLAYHTAVQATPTWFDKKRSFAFGIGMVGSSLGGVIYPIMMTRLVDEVGFPWAMRTVAFLTGFLLIVATVLVKSRTPPSPKPMQASDFAAPFKEPAYLLAIGAIFVTFLGFLVPYNFIVLQAASVGVKRNLAGYLLSIMNAVSIIGRLVPTKLADTYGPFTVMSQVCLLGGIFVTALWITAKSQSGIIAFSALYGLASGGITPLAVATVARLPAEPRTIPVRLGLGFMVVSFAVLISNPIAGAIVDARSGDFLYMQVFCGISLLVGGLLFLTARIFVSGVL